MAAKRRSVSRDRGGTSTTCTPAARPTAEEQTAPCPRLPDNDARGRRVLRFSSLPVAASNGGCPIHAEPSCVPGPPYGAPPDPARPERERGRHPRQLTLA